jgi:hypothetical protein
MKTTKNAFLLFVFLLFAFPQTILADGGFLDAGDSGESSSSGFLSGDSVADAGSMGNGFFASGDLVSFGDSIGDKVGDMIGDAVGDMVSSITEETMSSMGLAGNLLGGVAGNMAGKLAGDKIGDMVGDYLSDAFSSIAGIDEIQNKINGVSSSAKFALVGPNIPHFRILWMFSGESAIDEIKALFSGDYSNIKDGIRDLKDMF